MKTNIKVPTTVALVACLLCLLVFIRALFADFVNFDDQDFVLNNVAIRSLDWNFFVAAFTNISKSNNLWVPLTHVSFAIDHFVWGLDPFGYHLTNISLHAANTGLVVLIADKLCRKEFLGECRTEEAQYLYPILLLLSGLLFGLHPLRVGSVAWVSERKDVLNGFFSLGAIFFYLCYVLNRSNAFKTGTGLRYYLFSVVLLILAAMAKPTSVTIPVILLVIDWYPLGRFRKERALTVLADKIPFFMISVALSLIVLLTAAKTNYLLSMEDFPLWNRILVSGNALFEYCRLMFFPVGLSPVHIIPHPIPQLYLLKTCVILAVVASIAYAGTKKPILLASFLCFTIPLLPVLAFFQSSPFAFAAYNTYLPSVMPSIALSASMMMLYQRISNSEKNQRLLVGSAIISVVIFFTFMTQLQISVWQNSATMWTRVIKIQPYDQAYFLRGLYYSDSGQFQAAIDDFTTCLQIMKQTNSPGIFNLYAFRGEALFKAGRYDEAVTDFTAAITMHPHRLYFYYRGMALKKMGKIEDAKVDLGKAGQSNGQISWFGL